MLEFILPIGLIIPGLWLLQFARVRTSNNFERLSISYILSLAVMFGVLYLGGIANAFHIAAFAVLVVLVVSSVHLSLLCAVRICRSRHQFKALLYSHISSMKLVMVILTIGLLSVYALFLSSRAILDSDVAHEYLPIAREIVRQNGLSYSDGYDYNILLKPIGGSVLYAWTYIVSGSTSSETFRLMPLIPLLMLLILNYAIAVSSTKSKTIGIISTAVFLVLPFNDRFLLYNAFYPDMFYYPVVFTAIYFLLEYFKSRRSDLLLWTGIGFGVAGLLKAQTIYIFIAFMLVLFVLELRGWKKLSMALCCFAPFYILIPSILASSVQSEEFRLSVPSFTGTQLALFLLLSLLSGVCSYVTVYRKASGMKIDSQVTKGLVKNTVLLLVPFAVLSSLWYVNNLLRFGTLIWTSSINLPNLDWALGVLKPLQTAQQTADVWHYLANFMFMFVDPAVMGYVMVIPFLIGLLFALRGKMENLNILLILEIISAVVIMSAVVTSLPSASSYNPRDIFILAPLLTVSSAFGLLSVTSIFSQDPDDSMRIFISLILVAFFGLLSYVHSVFVWFTSANRATIIGDFMSSLGGIAGLNLAQASFQLSYGERAFFVGDNVSRIVSLSLICGVPVILLAIYCRYKGLVWKTLRLGSRTRSKRQLNFAEAFILIALLLHVIILPRTEMLLAQGGLQRIEEYQLKGNFGAFYELIADTNTSLNGGILTFKSPNGLPYYFPDIKIVDMIYPANLAFLKDCLISNSINETVSSLRQLGISYLLINPSATEDLDSSLNFSISKITQDLRFSRILQKLGSWKLYRLGPYSVEKTPIPLSSWSVDPQLTTASYNLTSDASHTFLRLDPTDSNSRVTILNANMPKLNLSSYDYIYVQLQGTSNARVLIRVFLNDGTSFDVSYWNDPYTVMNTPFDLESHAAKTLRGDVYISLKSSDALMSFIDISEISFMKISG